MSEALLRGIAAQEQINILSSASVSGGDINLAYKLHTDKGDLFLKANALSHGFKMLKAESVGLEAMKISEVIVIPQNIGLGQYENHAYLLLPFIESERPAKIFWEKLAIWLSELHRFKAEQSGWPAANFIGHLPQYNASNSHWPTFYAQQRIQPQLDMARDKQVLTLQELLQFSGLLKRLPELLPARATSLLHGDLWSGNFLCGLEQTPHLIDPACYHGHNEVDLAMSLLFGGFDSHFYDTYFSIHPKSAGLDERISIYQLYYLLVHLNLFGRSYWPAIENIIKKYTI